MRRKPDYLPTQEQIRAECLLIQSEWTEEERLDRADIKHTKRCAALIAHTPLTERQEVLRDYFLPFVARKDAYIQAKTAFNEC